MVRGDLPQVRGHLHRVLQGALVTLLQGEWRSRRWYLPRPGQVHRYLYSV